MSVNSLWHCTLEHGLTGWNWYWGNPAKQRSIAQCALSIRECRTSLFETVVFYSCASENTALALCNEVLSKTWQDPCGNCYLDQDCLQRTCPVSTASVSIAHGIFGKPGRGQRRGSRQMAIHDHHGWQCDASEGTVELRPTIKCSFNGRHVKHSENLSSWNRYKQYQHAEGVR